MNFAQRRGRDNPFDTSFGFANAAIGSFSSYAQASRYVEGNFIYNNTEGYIQDNWKVNNKLTLDYGVRFVHAQPQHDSLVQSGEIPAGQVDAVPGAEALRGGLRQQREPLHGHEPSGDEPGHGSAPRPEHARWRSARSCRTPAT